MFNARKNKHCPERKKSLKNCHLLLHKYQTDQVFTLPSLTLASLTSQLAHISTFFRSAKCYILRLGGQKTYVKNSDVLIPGE